MSQEARCGNRQRTDLEQCDDGNEVDGDGCSAQCEVEVGFTCKPGERGDVCSEICGDGIRSGEEVVESLRHSCISDSGRVKQREGETE